MNLKGSLLRLFGFFVFTACGPRVESPRSYIGPRHFDRIENDPREKTLIEAEFMPLALSFEQIWGKSVSTPIYFADLPSSELGVCIVWSSGSVKLKEIKVNRKSFGKNKIQSEMIIFHELGHCELNREHTTDISVVAGNRQIPFSLMFPVIFQVSDYQRFREHYVIELFERGFILERASSELRAFSDQHKSNEVIERNGFTAKVWH